MEAVPTLLLTGTVGAGKTAVATEIGLLLEERAIPAAVVDLDWLAWTHALPGDGVDALLAQNLAATWPNFRRAGARAFVLARALGSVGSVTAIRRAIPEADLTVVRLLASPAAVVERLRRRDGGRVLAEHLRESVELTAALDRARPERVAVPTDGRTPREVAEDVLGRWAPAAYWDD
jgi:adenylylsulfate kinase